MHRHPLFARHTETPKSRASQLNARFRTAPDAATTGWEMLASAGIMYHVTELSEHEDSEHIWRPGCYRGGCKNISLSLIHAAQHDPAATLCRQRGYPEVGFTSIPCQHPIFLAPTGLTRRHDQTGLGGAGIIFRPGKTPILCGKAEDSGGHCNFEWCPKPSPLEGSIPAGYNGDGNLNVRGHSICMWKPADFGTFLERQSAWQRKTHQLDYNEFIMQGDLWKANLPWIIDAFVIRKGFDPEATRKQHRRFLEEYSLTAADVPLLRLDITDWENPFETLPPPTPPPCNDELQNCKHWSREECDRNSTFMHANCKKTCGRCAS